MEIRKRAGVLCFSDETKHYVLLFNKHNSVENWSFPGGGIEEGETAIEAAKREMYEEAGFRGNKEEWIGEYDHISDDGKKNTQMFSLLVSEVLEEWPEKNSVRERRWVPIHEAAEYITKPKAKEFISKIAEGIK